MEEAGSNAGFTFMKIRKSENQNFRTYFRARLDRQGEKLKKRFADRPYSEERYKRTMTFIAALILAFLVFSIMCIIYTIGAWLQ